MRGFSLVPSTNSKAELLSCGFVSWSKLIPILLVVIVSTIGAATFVTVQHGSLSHHDGAMGKDRFDDFRKQFDAYIIRQSVMGQRMWEALSEIRNEVKKR